MSFASNMPLFGHLCPGLLFRYGRCFLHRILQLTGKGERRELDATLPSYQRIVALERPFLLPASQILGRF